MDFELFISEVEKRPAIWDPRDFSIPTGKAKQKRVYASKSTHLKQAFIGTVQCLFYDMAGAKRNGATTFLEFVRKQGQHFLQSKYKGISTLKARDEI